MASEWEEEGEDEVDDDVLNECLDEHTPQVETECCVADVNVDVVLANPPPLCKFWIMPLLEDILDERAAEAMMA